MLPKPQHHPPCLAELAISVLVARLVDGDFVVPVIRIGLRRHKVFLAAMPEAAVNVDCDLLLGKGNIDCSSSITRQWPMRNPESPPPMMKLPPNQQLRLRIP